MTCSWGEVLKDHYDAIVDFMVYGSAGFKAKADQLLEACDHYLFTSSARVYANSSEPIREDSPRLLDVCKDEAYLRTDEYALAKAREEDVLFHHPQTHWTIIRPCITYNVNRLQLGALEKDVWLHRVLMGRSLVLPKDIAVHETTMTYGKDVAMAMAALIGNPRAFGEAFHITGNDHMTWAQVRDVSVDVLYESGINVPVYDLEDSETLGNLMDNTDQIRYDRLYDRTFDKSKLFDVIGEMDFTPMAEGLRECLQEFLKSPSWTYRIIWKVEVYLNKMTGEKQNPGELQGKDKLIYKAWCTAPGLMNRLRKL